MADNEPVVYFILGMVVGVVAFYLYAQGKFGTVGTTYSATPVIVQQPGYYNPFYPGSPPIPPGHIIPL